MCSSFFVQSETGVLLSGMADLSTVMKRDGETSLDYHKRLIYGKLTDKTLADMDYSELSELVYGQPYSSDVARRMMYGSKRTLDLLDEERSAYASSSGYADEIDAKLIELRKERQKLYDMRAAFNKVVRERARQEELNEILEASVRSGNLPVLSYEPHVSAASDNDLLCSLNDIHYGIDIKNAWNTYNPEVCRQMMCRYLDKIIEIASRHGSENCYVFENGDSISGKIHPTIQLANRENVIEQIKGVSELISEFLAELSRHFRTVTFVSVAGNHSRLDTKDNSPLGERLDDLVEWYLSARLQNFDNIVIGGAEKIDSTMYLLDIRGKTYCGIHGDFDGSVSSISSLQTMAGRPVYCVLSGHLHHNKVDTVQGVKTVMAGSFMGMDDLCIQRRIYGKQEQVVCVCDNSGIGCYYDVQLANP